MSESLTWWPSLKTARRPQESATYPDNKARARFAAREAAVARGAGAGADPCKDWRKAAFGGLQEPAVAWKRYLSLARAEAAIAVSTLPRVRAKTPPKLEARTREVAPAREPASTCRAEETANG